MVKKEISVRIKQPPLYGLVLAGGRSRRMGRDKAQLSFHGMTQLEYAFLLLSKFCDRTFISIRKDQSHKKSYKGFPQIHDRKEYQSKGPLGGILSAMRSYPEVAWLVLACDLPLVNEKTVHNLILKRNRSALATAYKSPEQGLPEPLCAIYEPGIRPILIKFLSQDIQCPRRILLLKDIPLLKLGQNKALYNLNDRKKLYEFRKNL